MSAKRGAHDHRVATAVDRQLMLVHSARSRNLEGPVSLELRAPLREDAVSRGMPSVVLALEGVPGRGAETRIWFSDAVSLDGNSGVGRQIRADLPLRIDRCQRPRK
jgi:hypothetical protein